MNTFKNSEDIMKFICKQYYSEEKYKHAERVANFAHEEWGYWHENAFHQDKALFAVNLAWAHDLLEDTKCPSNLFDPEFDKALHFITWYKKEVSYNQYLQLIKNGRDRDDVGHIVWWVKLLDMRDHLTQTDTLTDKLREKYLSGLRYLL